VVLLPVAFDMRRLGVVRKMGAEGGPALAVNLVGGSEDRVGEVCAISVVDMNYMGQVVNQPRMVEGVHFGSLLAAGTLEGMTAVADIADLVGIAVDSEYIEELRVSIQVVGSKAAGKLP
jgi:hypothetical protein